MSAHGIPFTEEQRETAANQGDPNWTIAVDGETVYEVPSGDYDGLLQAMDQIVENLADIIQDPPQDIAAPEGPGLLENAATVASLAPGPTGAIGSLAEGTMAICRGEVFAGVSSITLGALASFFGVKAAFAAANAAANAKRLKGAIDAAKAGQYGAKTAACRLAAKGVTQGVYRFKNRLLRGVYTGSSNDVTRRLMQHLRAKKLSLDDLMSVEVFAVGGNRSVLLLTEQSVMSATNQVAGKAGLSILNKRRAVGLK